MARTKEFVEAEILDKAVDLFSAKGYNGISMQELVDGLGLNRSSLYDTFGDKRALYIAALKHYKKHNSAKMIAMFGDTTDVRKTLQDVLLFVVRESMHPSDRAGCLMVNSSMEVAPHEKRVNEIITENNKAIEDAIIKALKKARDNNEIKTTQHPRALARFFMNTINGLRVSGKVNCEAKAMEEIVKISLLLLDHP